MKLLSSGKRNDHNQILISLPTSSRFPGSLFSKAGKPNMVLRSLSYTKNLNYQSVAEDMLVRRLREQEKSIDIVTGKERIITDTPEKIIVNEIIQLAGNSL